MGFRFVSCRALEVGHSFGCWLFGRLSPSRVILACRWGFVPWFLSFFSVTNLDEPFWSVVSILLWLACVGPRALHSLGVAFPFSPCGVFFTLLQFGLVSLRFDLGFEFRPLQTWISIFWLGFQFSLGELCWFDLSISWSLSLYRLGELSWIYCCCSGYC